MNHWFLVQKGFSAEQEGLREALCTLGNGYFATRGAVPEAEADDTHYPGTYLAGGYNRLQTEIAGRTIENEDLVNLPNWLSLSFRINHGTWFNVLAVELLDYRQELDLIQGMLLRHVRFRDKAGREVELRQRRLVHMQNPHIAALETTLIAQNWSGLVEFRSALDGRVINAGVERYRNLDGKHLQLLESRGLSGGFICLKSCTRQSRLVVAQAARNQVRLQGDALLAERYTREEPGYVADHIVVNMRRGSAVIIDKTVALYSSRDRAISECGLEACAAVTAAPRFDRLLDSHRLAWQQLWRRFDFHCRLREPKHHERRCWIIHLHLFHLLQTVSPHTADLDVGVPARGWHGEAYRGHIFWDELFIFPLLNLRLPDITRALLKYRYRRLNAARVAARGAGFRGAMYPWQSAGDGREESQRYHLNPHSGRWLADNSHLQRHVSAAIAYNVWQYYQVTQDGEFLRYQGAEMMLEIARFWASIASYNPQLERYEILGVMGPDEYHEAYPDAERPGLDNNAYTNLMVVWVLARALDLLELLPVQRRQELCATLELEQAELAQWREISHKMRVVFHQDGIISQFEGYEALAELDWQAYRERYGNIQRLDRILEAEGDSTNRYKLSKQADVLMLFYLFSAEEVGELLQRLGYDFDPALIPKTIDYYMARTSHGSTLSRIVHSWVLARSDRSRSWQFFCEALESDIGDMQGGTTAEGIHLGAMAGSVDLMQRCYTGLETRGGVLRFNPCLPEELAELRMQIHYRGHDMVLDIDDEALTITSLEPGAATVEIGYRDRSVELRGGENVRFAFAEE